MIGGGFRGGFPGKPSRSKTVKGPRINKEVKVSHGLKPILGKLGSRKSAAEAHQAQEPPRSVTLVSPKIGGIAIIGTFKTWPWGQPPDEAYLADALEKEGIRVLRVSQEDGHPPLGHVSWAIFSAHPHSRGRMNKWLPDHGVALWTLDWLPHMKERKPVIEAARKADVLITSDKFNWKGLGIHHQEYLPGACEGFQPTFAPKPSRPCAFLGTLYNSRRVQIAKIVTKLGGAVVEEGWIYTGELARFVQQTKVIVGDNYRNDVPGYWSSRNYIIPGAGGFLLTAKVPELDTHLQPGTHVGVYDSIGDLENSIRWWLEHDVEREDIRRAGFEYTRENHTWRNRAQALIKILDRRVSLLGGVLT